MNKKPISDQLFYRSYAIDERAVDKEERSVEFSFSSEEPYMRWFGKEILLHGDGNVDLKRLKTMGSGLLNHNPNVIVGRLTDAKVEDKKGKATLIFDDDEESEKYFKKVQSKSLRGVSVGYMVNKYKEVKEYEEYEGIKGPAYIATRWTPYEISLTPIPADSTVGIGRDLTRSLEGIEIESNQKQLTEVKDMEKKEVLELINEVRKEDQAKLPELIASVVRQVVTEDSKPKLRISAEDMNSLMGVASALSPDAELKVARMVGEGKTKEEIQRALLEMKTKPDGTNTQKGSTDGLGKDEGKVTFEKLDDDLFFRSFCNPSIVLN